MVQTLSHLPSYVFALYNYGKVFVHLAPGLIGLSFRKQMTESRSSSAVLASLERSRSRISGIGFRSVTMLRHRNSPSSCTFAVVARWAGPEQSDTHTHNNCWTKEDCFSAKQTA